MRKYIKLLTLFAAIIASASSAKAQDEIDSDTQEVLEKMELYYSLGIDEKLYLQLDKPYYSAGEQIWFKGYLRNAITHTPLTLSNFIYVELISKDNKLISRVKTKRNEGGFSGYMSLDASLEEGDYTLRGYTRWMLNQDEAFFFSRSLKIISPLAQGSDDSAQEQRPRSRKEEAKSVGVKPMEYDLQFFAEGGALLANQNQSVAFKAIGEDGLSVEIKGAIYNSSAEQLVAIETTHKGMGMASIYAREGEHYYALVSLNGGEERRFELPNVEPYGAAIHSRIKSDKLVFQVVATHPSIIEGAKVILHSHGKIVSVSDATQDRVNALATEELLDGVNVISLIDSGGKVISERLVFKPPLASPTVEIEADRENYGSRDRVELSIQILDSSGQAAQGEFGLSVTDDSSVKFDAAQDNIISYLLLSSDIHGHIEDPALYLATEGVLADYNLDLVMRTQGWRRFSLERVLAEELEAPQHMYEDVVEISGNVKGFFGNEARRPNIHIFSSSQNYFDAFELDQSSSFRLVGLDIPDSTTYIIQARGRKGGNALTLNVEPEIFALPKATLSPRKVVDEPYVPVAFVNQSQDRFFYEGGINLIDLDAVYVTTTKREANDNSSFSTRSTDREQLEMMSGLSIPNIIQSFPNITIANDGVYYRGNSSSARFIVDGTNMEYSEISYLMADELERIDFYSGADAAMYSDAGGGVFVLEMRQGSRGLSDVDAANVARVSRLGYQRPAEFYQPKYDLKAVRDSLPPDYRTTIFWDGALSPDSDGNVVVEFFTADKATSYTITVEGVTDSGEICRMTKNIMRNLR